MKFDAPPMPVLPIKPPPLPVESLSWIDQQFSQSNLGLLIGISVLMPIPMWIASGIGLAVAKYPPARLRAGIFFASLSGFMVLAAIGCAIVIFANRPAIPVATAKPAAPAMVATVPTNYVSHSTATMGVTFCTPSNWQEKSGDARTTVTLFAPGQALSMNIRTVATTPGETLEQLQTDVPTLYAGKFKGFSMLHAEPVTLSGEPAMRVTFNATPLNDPLRMCQYFMMNNGTDYIVTFAAHPSEYDALLPTFDAVAVSLRLPGNTVPPPVLMAGTRTQPQPGHPPSVRAMDDLMTQLTPTPAGNPQRPMLRPRPKPAPIALPSAEATASQLKEIDAGWHDTSAAPVDLLPTMNGNNVSRDADGVVTISGWPSPILSPAKFRPPVTFRIVCLTQGKDMRLSYGAKQIIFNWEMRPTELRIDGGPPNGRHQQGVGQLPAGRWVGIELQVTGSEMVIAIDGTEIYRTAADFSAVNDPLRIESHVGSMLVKSVSVIQETK